MSAAVTPLRRPGSDRVEDARLKLDGLQDLCRNAEAEQALLGAILANNRALEAVADYLRPEHFGTPAHGRIYAGCLALVHAGRIADPIALKLAFSDDGDLEAVGGAGYLIDLASSVVSVTSASDYARTIVDMWKRRQSLTAMRDAAIAIAFPEQVENVESALAEVTNRLEMLAEGDSPAEGGLLSISRAAQLGIEEAATVYRAEGRMVGISTGLADLDRVIGGLRRSNFIIIAGRPGMGKSALAINIAEHAARHGDPVAFYSYEMSREQIWQRIVAGHTSIGVDRQQAGPLTAEDYRRICAAGAEAGELPIWIDDGRHDTVAAIGRSAKRLKRAGGLALIVVDYLQLMDGGQASNRTEEVSRITRGLKKLAKELDVPVVALSQLSRKVEERDDKRPLKSDLRESGSIEQDADQIIFAYRPEYYLREPQRKEGEDVSKFNARKASYEEMSADAQGVAELIVAKNRHGRERTVRAHWDGERQRFSNLGHGWDE